MGVDWRGSSIELVVCPWKKRGQKVIPEFEFDSALVKPFLLKVSTAVTRGSRSQLAGH